MCGSCQSYSGPCKRLMYLGSLVINTDLQTLLYRTTWSRRKAHTSVNPLTGSGQKFGFGKGDVNGKWSFRVRFEVKTSHGLGVYAHLGAFMRRTIDVVISLCPPYQNPPPITQALRKDERSELKAWVEVDFDKDLDFEGSTRLGSGGFGEVRTARWNGSDIAVKHLLVHALHDDTVRALRKEIRVHSSPCSPAVRGFYCPPSSLPCH